MDINSFGTLIRRCIATFVIIASLRVVISPTFTVLAADEEWIINLPDDFGTVSGLTNTQHNHIHFTKSVSKMKYHVWAATDGVGVDAMEKYFYGMKNGVALELGALGGKFEDGSETVGLEAYFGWKRVLIEAGPQHVPNLKSLAKDYSVHAVIAEDESSGGVNERVYHYVQGKVTSGILEFMSPTFLQTFFQRYYDMATPPGNMQSIDFTKLDYENDPWFMSHKVTNVHAVPLHRVLSVGNVSHVNLLVLDVEGAELSVLHTIDFSKVTFDVMVIETEAEFRPAEYFEEVSQLLGKHGYVCDKPSIGRNAWFRRKDFVPSSMPGRLYTDNCSEGHEWSLKKFRPKRTFVSNCSSLDQAAHIEAIRTASLSTDASAA